MCSDTWKRRVGLYGTHNNKPFPITATELKVAIDEGAATEVSVDVRHTLTVEHHTAVLWFPVSELRGISCFAAEVNGERIVGCLRRAVSQDATTPHPFRAPRDAESLYYFHAEGGDVLTDLPRGESVVLRLTFTTSLIPVDGQSKKQPCFMLPVASCFPRGVDEAQVTIKMKDLIREVYCVDPRDAIYPKLRYESATVSFRKNAAISPETDLFILGIETGPKIVGNWDVPTLVILIAVIIIGYAIHCASAGEVDASVFD
eukprot:Rhum_TRINITY_DN824_c0_g2::Rhum_TRINITY_DN824_c0_g2_i1::g.2487::m.2487